MVRACFGLRVCPALGSEPPSAGGSPGDDGALPGEAVGVVGEEADGWMVVCICVHVYMVANWRDFSIGKLNLWGGLLGGAGAARKGLIRLNHMLP